MKLTTLVPVGSLLFTEDAALASPVARVITMLKNMQERIKEETAQDEAVYSKLACWCKTNRNEKTEAVSDATAAISELEAKIADLTGGKESLSADIDRLTSEVSAGEKSLRQLEEVEEKRAKKAHKTEKDLVESTTQLKAAISVLSKHHPTDPSTGLSRSFLQQSAQALQSIIGSGLPMISEEDRNSAQSFLQGMVPSRPYAVQSAEIFGFLNQMLETMEGELASERAAAASALQMYTETHAAKKKELSAQRTELEQKEDLFGEGGVALAEAKKTKRETEETLAADQAFLADLEERCAATDEEIEARRKGRADELQALAETIQILMTDEARDLVRKTMPTAAATAAAVATPVAAAPAVENQPVNFLQRGLASSSSKGVVTEKLQKFEETRHVNTILLQRALRKASLHSRHPQVILAQLATSAQLNSFSKVKEAIDRMISDLKKQQSDETLRRDGCISNFNENEEHTLTTTHEEADLAAKMAALEQSIQAYVANLDHLAKEIAQDRVGLQQATVDRVAESKAYEQTYADQSAMQDVLHQAILRMKQYYDQKEESFLQQRVTSDPPSESLEKGGYKKQASATGAIQLLEAVLNDAKKALTEAVSEEQAAQVAYEKFIAETNKLVKSKQEEVVTLKSGKADAEGDLISTTESHQDTVNKLKLLDGEKVSLHTSCNFLIANFENTQAARAQEVESLQEAKSMLSGAVVDG